MPYSPQGFPYSRGFLRNLPFRKVLSSYEEECWSFWLQILSRGKCESTLAGVLRKKTITQVQTTMLAHQRHILNIEFVVPGKSHNRHCTPIVTNIYVCVFVLCGNNAVAVWDKKCELSVGDPCVFTMWLLLEDNIQLTICHSHSPTLAVKRWNQRFGWWSDFWVEGWWLEGWSIS